jgi:raffinose/stachyose/melibiose transport system permease protein
MAAYSIQRRGDKQTNFLTSLFMAGLMLPPAILPTIWVMQYLHIYKTMFSMVMIETALQMPFTILLYRGFMSTVPREMEEASYIDGCTKLSVYRQIIFPLLKPITATVIILDAVTIFNDFMNPLYFFPGKDNITVQLTLYNFMGKFDNSYNLLFADTILITLPMFLLFIIFNKKIIAGMSQGSVKG